MENKLIKIIVSSIFNAIPDTLKIWEGKFAIEGYSFSLSTISDWKNRKTVMRSNNRRVLKKILIEDKTLVGYEEKIRNSILKEIGIPRYRKSYVVLKNKKYEDFLEFVLYEITLEFIHEKKYNWKDIPLESLLYITNRKIVELWNHVRFSSDIVEIEKVNGLCLQFNSKISKNILESRVYVHIILGEIDQDKLKKFCEKSSEIYNERLLTLLFVTSDISDELYLYILREYNVFLLHFDAYDIDSIDVYKCYIPSVEEESLNTFLNQIAEMILQKIIKMNHIIMKEILYTNNNKLKTDLQYIDSNAGGYNYKYPIRRALSFEVDALQFKLREYAEKYDKKPTELLDINLTGGLYGLRLKSYVQNITCIDFTAKSKTITESVIQQYNKIREEKGEKIQNVQLGYLRVDNLNIVGISTPKDGYDVIVLGLGAGSYIEDLSGFIRKVSVFLKNDGLIFVSVYNKNALCQYLKQFDNMDFTYDSYYFKHRGMDWFLPVDLYSGQNIHNIVLKHLDVKDSYSYPTVLSIIYLDQSIEIMNKLKEIDKAYAKNMQYSSDNGIFNMVFAQAYDKTKIIQCYQETREYILTYKSDIKNILHENITSVSTMLRALSNKQITIVGNFMKCVLMWDESNEFYFFIALPLEKKIFKSNLELWYKNHPLYQMRKNKIRLCKDKELKELGLISGSISPFSYPIIRNKLQTGTKKTDMFLLYYSDFYKDGYIYTYSGSLDMTYRLSANTFVKFLETEGGIGFS